VVWQRLALRRASAVRVTTFGPLLSSERKTGPAALRAYLAIAMVLVIIKVASVTLIRRRDMAAHPAARERQAGAASGARCDRPAAVLQGQARMPADRWPDSLVLASAGTEARQAGL